MNYAWRVDKTNRRRTKVVSIAEARIKETIAWNSLLWPAKHETIRGDLIIPRSTAAGKFNSIGLIADIKSRAVTKIAVAFRARRRNGNGKWTKRKTSGKSVSIDWACGRMKKNRLSNLISRVFHRRTMAVKSRRNNVRSPETEWNTCFIDLECNPRNFRKWLPCSS